MDFTDASTGAITSYSWDFGDGGTSTLANPTHEYTSAEAKAVWNYLIVLEDRSLGIHNADFAEAILNAALEFVPE